jgi:hypothetical protein
VTVPSGLEPEAKHRCCWYSRRTIEIPPDLGSHTIEDGLLLYCVHPMLFPVVGYHFDVRNCERCDYFKPTRGATVRASAAD